MDIGSLKHKVTLTKDRIITILVCTLLAFFSYNLSSQDLKGKWVRIDDDDTYAVPESIVIEITKNELLTYSFDSLFNRTKLVIDTKNHLLKKGEEKGYKEEKYSLRDSIFLIEYIKGKEILDNKILVKTFESIYAKLLPTIINYPKDSILNKNYNHFYGTTFLRRHNNIKFNDVICSDQLKQIKGEDNCPRYKLEKIDKTYFIVYYWKKDHRKWMVPIKEINQDHLIVYGVSGTLGFVRLNEIKEISPSKKVFFRN